MKKVMIMAAVAFLVSVGVGAGARIALAPPAEDSTASETPAAPEHSIAVPAVGLHHETGAPPEPVTEEQAETTDAENSTDSRRENEETAGTRTEARDSGDREENPGTEGRGEATERGKRGAGSSPRATEAGTRDGKTMKFTELAGILGTMDSREAGFFLAHLEDDQVLLILRSMNLGQAADVLSYMPTKKADALRGRLLQDLGAGR